MYLYRILFAVIFLLLSTGQMNADEKIVFRHEGGDVVLLAANSQAYQELGRFSQPDRSGRPAWSHPVISNGQLYLRDMDKLLVYNISP